MSQPEPTPTDLVPPPTTDPATSATNPEPNPAPLPTPAPTVVPQPTNPAPPPTTNPTPSTNNPIPIAAPNNENIPPHITKALESYNIIFDINSLKKIGEGYPVYCSLFTFDEWKRLEHRGIFAAVIGDFKVGKTFIIGKLLELPTPADKVIHTTGICVAFKNFTTKAVVNKTEAKPNPLTFRKLQGKGGAKATTSTTAHVPAKEFEFIVLDTAGTDTATHFSDLKDTRATEVFLRNIILNISSRVIFVANKFERSTQEKLYNLVKQLRHCRKEVSSNRRILVVHNLFHIETKADLDDTIASVRDCYERTEPLAFLDEDDDEVGSSGAVPWAARTHEGIEIYDTVLASHFFLVNENAPVTSTFNPQDYNARVIKALRGKVYETDPIQQPLLQKIIKAAGQQLPRYLKEWTYEHCLVPESIEEDKYLGGLVPYKYTGEQDSLPLDFFMHSDYQSKLEASEQEYWRLTGMRFVDGNVMSENSQELQGSWFLDKPNNSVVVYVRAPGFSNTKRTEDSLRFIFEKKENWVEVHVKLDKPVLPAGCEEIKFAPRIREAHGVYRATFPEELNYLKPKNKKEFYEKSVQTRDGEIWISFEVEDDVFQHDE